MKRLGAGTRDSPTKDRYAGTRQQQQSGRGGRRQKSGSRGQNSCTPIFNNYGLYPYLCLDPVVKLGKNHILKHVVFSLVFLHDGKDVSPVPPAWPPLSTSPSPAHSPVLTPHQISLQQQHVTDIITKTPVNEIILQIKKLTFPSSCAFVLSLLEKYVMYYQ